MGENETNTEELGTEEAAAVVDSATTDEVTTDAGTVDAGNEENAGATDEGAETSAEAGTVVEDQEPDETPSWAKKRFSKLTRQKYEAKAESERLAEENQRLKEQIETQKNQPKPLGEKPQIDNFETEEEFFEALTDWKLDKRDHDMLASTQAAAKQDKQVEAQQSRQAKTKAMMDAGGAAHEDFYDAVTKVPGNLFRQEVIDTIIDADNSAEVAYFLATNLDDAAAISDMSGAKRAIEIGKISARLASPPGKSTTKAPNPITPVKGNGEVKVDEKKLSDQEWLEHKRAQRRRPAA
jgi:hypothetical protein